MTLPLFLFMPSSPADLIMEMHFYMEFQTLSLISSSEHKTQLLVFFQKLVNDGKSPVGAYKRVKALQLLVFSKQFLSYH